MAIVLIAALAGCGAYLSLTMKKKTRTKKQTTDPDEEEYAENDETMDIPVDTESVEEG